MLGLWRLNSVGTLRRNSAFLTTHKVRFSCQLGGRSGIPDMLLFAWSSSRVLQGIFSDSRWRVLRNMTALIYPFESKYSDRKSWFIACNHTS